MLYDNERNLTYRKQKNRFNPSTFSKCLNNSGSMSAISCCSVDNCFFIPLWSRRKFCFCRSQVMHEKPMHEKKGKLAILFITSTKHQKVISSLPFMTT